MTQAQESLFRTSKQQYYNKSQEEYNSDLDVDEDGNGNGNRSAKEIMMLDQHGNRIERMNQLLSPKSTGRSQESDERVHLMPTTEPIGTNTTSS